MKKLYKRVTNQSYLLYEIMAAISFNNFNYSDRKIIFFFLRSVTRRLVEINKKGNGWSFA